MSDLFGQPDLIADLLARVEALEAMVYGKAEKPKAVKPDEALNEAWQLWNRHRNGKGWTAKARELSMRTLRELAGTDGSLALKIVEQSVERGWTGLFPLREATGPNCTGSGMRMASQAPSAVQTKTVAEALAPSESREERDRAYIENQRRLGLM